MSTKQSYGFPFKIPFLHLEDIHRNAVAQLVGNRCAPKLCACVPVRGFVHLTLHTVLHDRANQRFQSCGVHVPRVEPVEFSFQFVDSGVTQLLMVFTYDVGDQMYRHTAFTFKVEGLSILAELLPVGPCAARLDGIPCCEKSRTDRVPW